MSHKRVRHDSDKGKNHPKLDYDRCREVTQLCSKIKEKPQKREHGQDS